MQGGGVGIGAQLGLHVWVPHCAGDKGQCLQMLNARVFGGKQSENQINGLAVHSVKVQRLFQTQEHPTDPRQIIKPCMG